MQILQLIAASPFPRPIVLSGVPFTCLNPYRTLTSIALLRKLRHVCRNNPQKDLPALPNIPLFCFCLLIFPCSLGYPLSYFLHRHHPSIWEATAMISPVLSTPSPEFLKADFLSPMYIVLDGYTSPVTLIFSSSSCVVLIFHYPRVDKSY